MGLHNIQDRISRGPIEIPDPGDAGAIRADVSGHCDMTSTGGDTRTLADPEKAGLLLVLTHSVDGGSITVTAASGVNLTGDNTIVFTGLGSIMLYSVKIGSAYKWRAFSPCFYLAVDTATLEADPALSTV